MPFLAPTIDELTYLSTSLYIISLLFIVGCVDNNIRIVKKLRFQDIMILVSFVLYSGTLCLIVASGYSISNDIPVQLLNGILTDTTEVRRRVTGSILILCLEQTAVLTIWTIKLTLISFLFDLASMEQMHIARFALKWITAYTFGGFVILETSMYGILCRPVKQYWAVPVNNLQCATYSTFSIIQLAFSSSASIMIMGIASSVAYGSQLSRGRMILAVILFGMGIITIVTAVLSLYYRLKLAGASSYRLFDIIEASIAMWIGCLVCSRRLLSRIFHRRSFENAQRGHPIRNNVRRTQQSGIRNNRNTTCWGQLIATITLRSKNRAAHEELEMNNGTRRSRARHTNTESTGTIMLPHAELSQYLYGSGPSFNNVHSLADDPDAGPALAYRLANRID